VWLHGFTQSRNSAHQFRSILAGRFELLTFDLPGHGESSQIHASLEETADLLVQSLPDEPVFLGGYSYGARVALHVAVRHPERVGQLVLLSASRGIEDPLERMARERRDKQLADRIGEIGVTAFLDEWLSQPMFSQLPIDPVERAARSSDAVGLAESLRRSGTGTQGFLGPSIQKLPMRTLCVAGTSDTKFSTEALAIAELAPLGWAELLQGASHAAHLEKPEECADVIMGYLTSASSS